MCKTTTGIGPGPTALPTVLLGNALKDELTSF